MKKTIICGAVLVASIIPALADQYWVVQDFDLETLLDRHREADNDYNDRCGASRVPNSDRSREFNENHKGVHVRLRVRLEPTEGFGPPLLAALLLVDYPRTRIDFCLETGTRTMSPAGSLSIRAT